MQKQWNWWGRSINAFSSQLPDIHYSGVIFAVGGTLFITLLILGINTWLIPLPNPGLLYLPLVAMLAYYWKPRYALTATILQLLYVYFFFLPPSNTIKRFDAQNTTQLLILAAVTGFVLLLTQVARQRQMGAERAAERLALLNRVGTSLTSELEESRLLHQIAEVACNLTGAGFAAFTLRPIDELGQPTVPSEGNLFYLAAVVGVTEAQEELFRRMPLGGEGLLAPIFRQGMPVRVTDALDYPVLEKHASRDLARQAALDYAKGHLSTDEGLRSLGVPPGHPLVRSFLGVPLFDRDKQVRGGLLLGHMEPGRFTREHEQLLVGLAAQASVALENTYLYRTAQMRAQELNAIFERIADGVVLVDSQGTILRENHSARSTREMLQETPDYEKAINNLLHIPTQLALTGDSAQDITVYVTDTQYENYEYLVNASPLHRSEISSDLPLLDGSNIDTQSKVSGAVVTWHDMTETRRLANERRAYAESEARRTLLQLVLDELPSSVYLVRGYEARLVLANRAATMLWGASWKHGQTMKDFLTTHDIRIFGNDGLILPSARLATLRAVQQGETVHQQQEVIRHADGTFLPVLVNAVALSAQKLHLPEDALEIDKDALPETTAIVVHQDVTALKEAEQLKDEFIGIAAHELRTPLAVLKGYTQMLLVQSEKGRGAKLVDWQLESLQSIDQATQRLVELTEDLLDVTRLQGGRLALHSIPTDLLALARRVIKRLQLTTDKHTLTLASPVEYLVVDVDPQRMEQILGNLIGNAIKYSPDGGPIEISVKQDQEKQTALLSIRDQGIGIPAQQQTQIFGRFVRADNAREYGIGGTGLGLYLCRELIERHYGHIWFESSEGEGATFYIALPLHNIADEMNSLQ